MGMFNRAIGSSEQTDSLATNPLEQGIPFGAHLRQFSQRIGQHIYAYAAKLRLIVREAIQES
jgi:hypothetical protein